MYQTFKLNLNLYQKRVLKHQFMINKYLLLLHQNIHDNELISILYFLFYERFMKNKN